MGDYRGSIGKLYVKPIVDLKTAMEALDKCMDSIIDLSLIHISEPTRRS